MILNWPEGNPRLLHENLDAEKVTVEGPISTNGIIGPCFFRNEAENTVNVNSEL